MTDNLRSTLEAAVAQAETSAAPAPAQAPVASPAPAPAPTPAPSPAPASAPAQDDGIDALRKSIEKSAEEQQAPGTKPAGEDTPTDPKTVEKAAEEPTGEPAPEGEQTHKGEKAPQSWKPAQKAKWDKLDPDVRQEIVRRERQIEKTLSETTQVRQFAKGIQEAVNPFMGRLRAHNVNPVTAIRNLLAADHLLATSPADKRAQIMAKMINDYQVDITLLDTALAGEPVAPKPQDLVDQLVEQKLAPFRQFMETQAQTQQQAVQKDFERAQETVQSMEANTEKFPHFDAVREDIADIIELSAKRNIFLSVEEAYNRAVKMNPETSRLEQESAQRKQATQAHATAQRALGASLSVGGAPTTTRTSVDPSNLRSTLEAAIQSHSGR